MADTIALPPPRLALIAEAREVHGVLWSCRKEIPLKDSFIQPQYVDWVRDHCANGRFWVIDLTREIAGVMLVTPAALGVIERGGIENELFYLAVKVQFRRLGIAAALLAHAQSEWSELVCQAQEENSAILVLLERAGFIPHPPLPGGWVKHDWLRDDY